MNIYQNRIGFPSCAVMVLNWNGADWLRKCLPSVLIAASNVGAEVWVVDNNSSDDSAELCRILFPSVRFEALESNKILASYNVAAERSDKDVIVLLNNDLLVDENFLPPLMEAMKTDDKVFAVSPCVRGFPPGQDAPIEMEAETAYWTNGMIRGCPFSSTSIRHTRYTMGGAMACFRSKFLDLGGFDELFSPGYFEDVDLSYRAWKRGWICQYVPSSIVYHMGGVTFGRSEQIKAIILRNEFLFHWKNLSNIPLIASHILTMLPRLIIAYIRHDNSRLKGFYAALLKLNLAMRSRAQVRHHFVLDDAQVLAIFSGLI